VWSNERVTSDSHRRGTGGNRWLRDLGLPLGLTLVAAVLAHLTWGGRYLLVPAAWLLTAPIATSLLSGPRPALVAAAAGALVHLFAFVPPRWSFRVTQAADIPPIVAFAAMALGVTLALEQVERARRTADRSLTSLDALLAHAPIGIAFLDRDLRFVRVNAAMAAQNERPVEQHLGRALDDVIDDPGVAAVARRSLTTGVPAFDVPFSRVSPRSGRTRHVLAGYYPVVAPDGTVSGMGVVVRDVTAAVESQADRAALLERATRLQDVTGALAAARTMPEVVRVVLDEVRRGLGARAAAFCMVADGEVTVLGAEGYPEPVVERWKRFSLDASTPFAEAIRNGRMETAGSRDEILRRWPELAGSLQPGARSLAALPVLVDGEPAGAIGMSFDSEQRFDEGDRAFLDAVAAQCAQAVVRAHLYESEQAARAASEAAAVRLAFLAESSAALAASLDWEATLRQVATLAVPKLADWCAVFVGPDGGAATALELAHANPDQRDLLRHAIERWPVDVDDPVGLGAVLRTGEPLLVPDVSLEQLRAVARDDDHLAALREVGFRSVLAVPMRAQERVVGLIAMATAGERRLDEEDLALTVELATRAGQAVLNAQLFEERSHVARTLQASLLPPATPRVPGIEVATRFFALGRGIDVGGDFYDVFRMGPPGSDADCWAVVIGDVRGKGT
jgi:GAF domain-containing protein/PAS domain-containing protein